MQMRPLIELSPRPLPLYLGLASLLWQSLPILLSHYKTVLPSLSNGWDATFKDLLCLAQQEHASLKPYGDKAYQDFLQGIEVWRTTNRPDPLPPVPIVWQQGHTTLKDYGHGEGQPLLVVPSLINKAHILDMSKERSFLRYLATEGFRPLLVDWGTPSLEECAFTVDDYITHRLLPVIEYIHAKGPIPIVGYCMGGLLSMAAAYLAPTQLSKIILLATPFDMHQACSIGQRQWLRICQPWIEQTITALGYMPVDMIQVLLASYNPFLVLKRYIALGNKPPNLVDLIQIEDWLNDGVPLAGPVARTALFDWYMDNTPFLDQWQVLGHPINPRHIYQPTLIVSPKRDAIVAPSSALVLQTLLPQGTVHQPETGHIGMVVGRHAATEMWESVVAWLRG
jgi:polyhydroxyalkanoate synthase subunit PhaC